MLTLMGFGQTSLSGVRRGLMPPQLKTNKTRMLPVILQLFRVPKGITGSILTLLQYPMTLRQCPKDPVLPTLT